MARLLMALVPAACILGGCGGPDAGTPAAPIETVTQEQLSTMPPEAARHAQGMSAYGEAQKKSMQGQNQGRPTGQ